MQRHYAVVIACSWLIAAPAWAERGPSETSAADSTLPIATIASGVGASAGLAVAIPVALSVQGGVLVVRSVEMSARGMVCVLERVADGARVSVIVAARGIGSASVAVGTVVTTTVTASGVILSAAGEAIAFIPNQMGLALLHDERVTR